MSEKYVSVQTAAQMIAVSPWTIRKWIRQHKIRVYRFGGAIRIKVDDLLSFGIKSPDVKDIGRQMEVIRA
jgi:excisionase family DNA binding protein